MILAVLLLTQTPTWPAVRADTAAHFVGSNVAKASNGPFSLKDQGKAFTREILFYPSTHTKIRIGGATLVFDRGVLELENGRSIPAPTATTGAALELTVTRLGKESKVYANGKIFTSLTSKAPETVVTFSGTTVDQFLGFATYSRSLTAAEVQKNATAGLKLADGVPDSSFVTLDVTLRATTEVPDPSRIKPYRNALLAQEYTLKNVIEGHVKGLKQGAKVRVFRYGVFDGKKTDVQNQKAGDPLKLTVELMSSNPTRSHEYQIDDLDPDMLAKYYVEVRNASK